MTSPRLRHRTYDPDVEKVVAKDAVVLDLDAANPHRGSADLIVQNIISALRNGTLGCRYVADQIEAQTKPARIAEPGLWGVVEAVGQSDLYEPKDRLKWVHVSTATWRNDVCGYGVTWDDLIDPILIRDGVES